MSVELPPDPWVVTATDKNTHRLPDATMDAIADSPELNATIDGHIEVSGLPLAILRARLAKSTTEAVRVAFCGSSTTAGSNATAPQYRYVDRFVKALQGAYPAPGGVESAVVASTSAAFGTLSTVAGVHGYNAGEGGTTSTTYLTAAERTAVAALNPAMVMHMVFANDYRFGTPVATAKANLIAVIDDLRSKITVPCVQVLVNSYPRFDAVAEANKIAPWSDYGRAMREVADLYPDAVYIDLAPSYALVGIPGADPLNLIDSDDIHQTDQGHALMADLLKKAFSLTGGGTGTVTTTNLIVVYVDSASPTGPYIYTSDTFSGGNATTLVGRTTDVGLLGTPKALELSTTDAALAISSGAVVAGATAAGQFFGFDMPLADQFIRAKIVTKPTGSASSTSIYLDARRVSAAANTTTYRLQLTNATMVLRKIVAGASTDLQTGIAYAAGDVVELRCLGTTISVLVNGTVVATVTDAAVSSTKYAGISRGSSAAGFIIDDVVWGIVA